MTAKRERKLTKNNVKYQKIVNKIPRKKIVEIKNLKRERETFDVDLKIVFSSSSTSLFLLCQNILFYFAYALKVEFRYLITVLCCQWNGIKFCAKLLTFGNKLFWKVQGVVCLEVIGFYKEIGYWGFEISFNFTGLGCLSVFSTKFGEKT